MYGNCMPMSLHRWQWMIIHVDAFWLDHGYVCAAAADLHLIDEEVWFPQHFSGNWDLSDSTELSRIPGNKFIVPHLKLN